jgi:hypothetical protein
MNVGFRHIGVAQLVRLKHSPKPANPRRLAPAPLHEGHKALLIRRKRGSQTAVTACGLHRLRR